MVLPPADEAGGAETQEERRPTSVSVTGLPRSIAFELSRDEGKAKVRETIAMVDRWYDSDDWKPWTPPTPEEELRQRSDPDAMRPEIADNEERYVLEYRQLMQNPTTVQQRASASSGREVLDPTPIEKAAVAIVNYHSR